jgi:hypothetical protein
MEHRSQQHPVIPKCREAAFLIMGQSFGSFENLQSFIFGRGFDYEV